VSGGLAVGGWRVVDYVLLMGSGCGLCAFGEWRVGGWWLAVGEWRVGEWRVVDYVLLVSGGLWIMCFW
jgi:hypothetical protein